MTPQQQRGLIAGLALVLVVALAIVAFAVASNDDDTEATPTATATTTVTSTPTRTPTAAATTPAPTATAPAATATSTRANVPPAVDAVINAALRGDTAALEQMVRLTSLPCGPQQGPGSPPACPAGQPNGTPVEVFPIASCEGELRTRAAVRPTLETVTNGSPRLFGVYRAPDPYVPQVRGEYVAVFSRQMQGNPGLLGAGIVVASDRIVGI